MQALALATLQHGQSLVIVARDCRTGDGLDRADTDLAAAVDERDDVLQCVEGGA